MRVTAVYGRNLGLGVGQHVSLSTVQEGCPASPAKAFAYLTIAEAIRLRDELNECLVKHNDYLAVRKDELAKLIDKLVARHSEKVFDQFRAWVAVQFPDAVAKAETPEGVP